MKRKKLSKGFILAGLLLIAAALVLTVYNIDQQNRAARSSAEALAQLARYTAAYEESLNKKAEESPPPAAEPAQPESVPETELIDPEVPEYVRNPDTPMPELTSYGLTYIGVLTVPALNLELPIISQWSYDNLYYSPCRWMGSAYLDNLIIMGHNYSCHFGSLAQLQIGDDVYFEDVVGNVFHYSVVELESLEPTAVEDMMYGDWDLTLFTCTVGGRARVTVRCDYAQES